MQSRTINTILVSSAVVLTLAGVYTLFRKGGSLFGFAKRIGGAVGLNEEPTSSTSPKALSDEFVQSGLDNANALLQKKRAVYEAKWKKSGSLLSFKDWYIENAV
jgi:hypothetical protein